jgi:hypothetical protein
MAMLIYGYPQKKAAHLGGLFDLSSAFNTTL